MLDINKNFFIYGITPKGFSDDEYEINDELKNLKRATWEIINRAGANIGDYLIIKNGLDDRDCVKKGDCEKLEKGIYAIGKITYIDDYVVSFEVIYNFYYKPITSKKILDLKGFGLQNRGLAKLSDKNTFLNLIQNYLSPNTNNKDNNMEEININQIIEYADILRYHKQIIFQGAPGTGKTRLAKQIARYIIKEETKPDIEDMEEVELIQFHPSYSYEDFVRGIVAKTENQSIKYEVEDKILAQMAKKALENEDKEYILIIDEINRANLSAVLGELIYALEYRGEAVESMYDKDEDNKIILPENLYIIGTMNTADRSVGHIDYAIRRRFVFIGVEPNEEAIDNEKGRKLFKKIEEEIFDKYLSPEFEKYDVMPGHSYFILNDEENIVLYDKTEYQVIPLLREYMRDGILKSEAKEKIDNLLKNLENG